MSKQTSSATDDGSLNIAFFSVLVVSLFLLFMFSEGEALPKEGEETKAFLSSIDDEIKDFPEENDVTLYGENAFFAKSTPTHHKTEVRGTLKEKNEEEKVKRRRVNVTAYAPLDPNAIYGMDYSGDPTITASGSRSREGIVAANFLEFGTKIRIPALFGDEVLVVEDRMAPSFDNTVDVLLYSRQEALNFGTKNAYIEVLKN